MTSAIAIVAPAHTLTGPEGVNSSLAATLAQISRGDREDAIRTLGRLAEVRLLMEPNGAPDGTELRPGVPELRPGVPELRLVIRIAP